MHYPNLKAGMLIQCSFIQNKNFMEWQCLRSRAEMNFANTQLCIMKYAELISALTKLSADYKN